MIVDLSPDQPFAPPADAVFQHLLSEAAVNGSVSVYGVVLSPARLVPFDPTFKPEQFSAEGPSIIAAILARWDAGHPPQPWVYPRGNTFVVSDDYFSLAAIRKAAVDSIACQCLGEPKPENVYSATGPLTIEWVRQALNIKVAD